MPGSRIPRLNERDADVEDVDETLEDEELDEDGDAEDLDGEAPAPAATPAAAAGGEPVESIQEILVKQEAADEGDEDDDTLLNLGREERLEPLAVKVVPPQPTEFICSNCFLVKHRSQLKDKAKVLCRDCA
jgi:Domain of unknown function (DUF4193)